MASNTASRGAATSHSSTNTYSREASARIAFESARWTRADGLAARPVAPKSRTSSAAATGDGQPKRLTSMLGEAAQERLGVAGGAELHAHAARAVAELAVRRAGGDGHRVAGPQDVLAAVDHEPHRALDHLVALLLLRVDVRLRQEAAVAADHVELDELAAGLLARLADLDNDAQPGHLECGHGAYALDRARTDHRALAWRPWTSTSQTSSS